MQSNNSRRKFLLNAAALSLTQFVPQLLFAQSSSPTKPIPIRIGLDAELRDTTSTSDDAIRAGIEFAIEDINQAGGLLDGRKLELMILDNRVVPSRGVENLATFAQTPDLVAMFCGKFSPVVMQQLISAHQFKLPLLDPWAAADGIVDNGYTPNYVFRLSLRDSWAIKAMLFHALKNKLNKIGLLVPNNGWGRSCKAATERCLRDNDAQTLIGVEWYNWGGDKNLLEHYANLRKNNMDALLLVANEPEGARLVNDLANLSPHERVPIISHWGITGGDFATLAANGLAQTKLSVVQTFNFDKPRNAQAKHLAERSMQRFKVDHPNKIVSAVGIAHAYDLTHLLALAIKQANSTDREKIHHTLENLPTYEGVVKRYAPAFDASRHEALNENELFMARYTNDRRLVRME